MKTMGLVALSNSKLNNEKQTMREQWQRYINQNWRLVPLKPFSKAPSVYPGWNKLENTLNNVDNIPHEAGVGIAHAYSGTMALDVDNWQESLKLLANEGIDLQALYNEPSAVIIDSSRANHGKLLYAMPDGLILSSKKITYKDSEGVNQVAYELRCATTLGLTVQDALPPTIHPDTGKPYKWAGGGSFEQLPELPDVVLSHWQSVLNPVIPIKQNYEITSDWSEINKALGCISPDLSRDEWVGVGMALHDTGIKSNNAQYGFDIFNKWSSASSKYKGYNDVATVWNSFKSEKGIGLGTLFHMAGQNGYTQPTPDAQSLFGAVNETNQVERPDDILNSLRPPPPEINLELWPAVIRQRAQEISSSVGCDPTVPLFAAMAACSGAADAQIRLELAPGFLVPPVLWLMTIGEPADKKSPGSKPLFKILRHLEKQDRKRYAQDVLQYEGAEAAYNAAKKAFLQAAASEDMLLDPDYELPNVPELPVPPIPLKITMNDITSQKMIRQCSDRPRGMLCHMDEMAAWVNKITAKFSKEDRSSWTVSYESDAYEMDRVGAGSIYCDNLAVSIYGNIQPQVLRKNINALAEDGLIVRFIPAVLRQGFTKKGQPLPEYLSNNNQYEQLIRSIFSLPKQVYKLSDAGKVEFDDFQNWYYQSIADERIVKSDNVFMNAFGKIEGTLGRLILLFHLIENPYGALISADIVNRVAIICKSFIVPSHRYVLSEVAGLANDTFDVWMTEYIIQHAGESTTLTMRQIKRASRRKLEKINTSQAEEMIKSSMYMLTQCHWVSEIESKGARVVWLINPELAKMFKQQRQAVIQAKQRQLENIIAGRDVKKGHRTTVTGFTKTITPNNF